MLSVTNKPFMMTAIMLNAVMLSVIMLSVTVQFLSYNVIC
jgi:hypothetical protein